jgi:hypothetical protein
MRADDRFDIKPLLVAEIVIHRSNVRTRTLANIAHGRAIKTTFREDFPSGIRNPFSGIIYVVFSTHWSKPSFQTTVSINCTKLVICVN